MPSSDCFSPAPRARDEICHLGSRIRAIRARGDREHVGKTEMPSSPLLGRSNAWDSPFFARHVDAPPARHTEHVARPLVSIADDRSLLAVAVHCRHGSKLMAVPRGVRGLTAMPPRPVGRLMRPPTRTRAKREAPGEAACAAETGRPLLLCLRPLKQTHGQMGGTLPCTMRNATLGARGAFAFPRVRSRMLSGGGACAAGARPPPPQRQRRR